jgi:glycosyltransferase involved in cell wall biosynthesis
MNKPKILYLITEDWYFCSHRLELAKAAQKAGYEVLVATHVAEHGEAITQAGFALFPLRLQRLSRNPFAELVALWQIIGIYRRQCPDIVHHVGLKPILYGSLAARLSGVTGVVNAIAGLGQAAIKATARPGWVRRLVMWAYRWSLKGSHVVVQNNEDREALISAHAACTSQCHIIRGSGVDIQKFSPQPAPPGVPVVMLASRMIWAKGISEFVEAARKMISDGSEARMVLVGEPDPGNRAAVPKEQLDRWVNEGVVEWWGRCDDMPTTLAKASVVCLPSFYGEGVPMILLEAAACGRPLVATDTPGCRDIARQGENGTLVPVKNAEALAAAITGQLKDPDLRARMAKRGRAIVVEEFSLRQVCAEFLQLYGGLVPTPKKPLKA